MATVTVYEPTAPTIEPGSLKYATRGELADGLDITLVNNGKPRAKELLEFLGEELKKDLPIRSVEVFSKPSAGKPLTGDEAKVIAARSHLVITGVGD
jgi:hypothetical protein